MAYSQSVGRIGLHDSFVIACPFGLDLGTIKNVSLGEYMPTKENPIMCKKAVAVDTALQALAPKGSCLEISAQFIKTWSEKAKELGGSLSARRIQKAIENLGLRTSLTPCAKKHIQSSGWIINIGPSPPHTKYVGGNNTLESVLQKCNYGYRSI